MHTEYVLSFIVNVFDMCEDKRVMLKSEYKYFVDAGRICPCTFVIKLGALKRMITRFYQACVYDSVKCCAGYFDNQKLVGNMLIKYVYCRLFSVNISINMTNYNFL